MKLFCRIAEILKYEIWQVNKNCAKYVMKVMIIIICIFKISRVSWID